MYCADGIHAIADALPRSCLVTLLCNGNGLRDEGASAMARALVSTPQRGTLTTLALEGNAIGVDGCKALAAALLGRPGGAVPGSAVPGGTGLPEAQ